MSPAAAWWQDAAVDMLVRLLLRETFRILLPALSQVNRNNAKSLAQVHVDPLGPQRFAPEQGILVYHLALEIQVGGKAYC